MLSNNEFMSGFLAPNSAIWVPDHVNAGFLPATVVGTNQNNNSIQYLLENHVE